eukprot:5427610-Pleurochrysis_carterae.AAC.1
MRGEHFQSERKVRVPHKKENKSAGVISLKLTRCVTPQYKERHISETEKVENPSPKSGGRQTRGEGESLDGRKNLVEAPHRRG